MHVHVAAAHSVSSASHFQCRCYHCRTHRQVIDIGACISLSCQVKRQITIRWATKGMHRRKDRRLRSKDNNSISSISRTRSTTNNTRMDNRRSTLSPHPTMATRIMVRLQVPLKLVKRSPRLRKPSRSRSHDTTTGGLDSCYWPYLVDSSPFLGSAYRHMVCLHSSKVG